MKGHLSSDELLELLYGLDGPGGGHLNSCPDCLRRFRAFERRRAQDAAAAPLPAELLFAQKRAVYARIERREPSRPWAPATAAALLIAASMYMLRPAAHAPALASSGPVVVRADTNDAQLFRDVYWMEQTAEPRAAAPMHALFDSGQPDAAPAGGQ